MSIEKARKEYGVVIDEGTMMVNEGKTTELRDEKVRERGPVTWVFDRGTDGKE